VHWATLGAYSVCKSEQVDWIAISFALKTPDCVALLRADILTRHAIFSHSETGLA
jgi:hypothetical protein